MANALGFLRIYNGLTIKLSSNTPSGQGDIVSDSSTGNLLYHNGTTSAALASASNTITLSNKSIDASANTLTNIVNSCISSGAAIAYSKLALAGSIANSDLATVANNTVKGNTSGSTASPSDITLASAATASSVMYRDANANSALNNLIEGFTTTATAAGTTTLTVSSTYARQFTGTTTQTVVLPAANSLTLGQSFLIMNRSTGIVTVNANGGSLIQAMAANSQCIFTVTNIGSTTGAWDASYSTTSSGTVTSVGVAVGAGGMTVSGSPVTGSGTITITPKLPTTSVVTTSSHLGGFSANSSGTYTTPAGALYIRVRMVGGGGGGLGGGTATGTAAGSGGNTTFGTTLLVANGGGVSPGIGNPGGSGGTASLGTGPVGLAFTGAAGAGAGGNTTAPLILTGSCGGASPFGGAGSGGAASNGNGLAAQSNTGSGGGGGASGANTGAYAGAGGGAGGYVDAIITSPSSTYSYAVGAAGTAGGAGTGGGSGGAGGSGIIIIDEFYQ